MKQAPKPGAPIVSFDRGYGTVFDRAEEAGLRPTKITRYR
jgi:hypothetical protein